LTGAQRLSVVDRQNRRIPSDQKIPGRSPSPRGEEAMPGVYRLRLPMPWHEAPLGNAWALADQGGLVLIDTGVGGTGALAGFEDALGQVGFGLGDIHLLVCTHGHADHLGLAARIVAATGVPYWIHPAWDHIRQLGEDPAAKWACRREFMRTHGAPEASVEDFRRSTAGWNIVDGIVEPDRDLLEGTVVATDLGDWTAHFTPGHDPSHVVLHQPERRLLVGGDLLIEGAAPFFEYGFSPDPVGELLASLDVAEGLDFDTCFPGHGRLIGDGAAAIEESRATIAALLAGTEAALAPGERTAAAIAIELLGADADKGAYVFRLIQNVLAALDHLAARGRVERVRTAPPVTWRLP
jgi:glyoxylase-like metal-dependent hydrolase (beta-lactamase superfamily II)